MTQKQECVREYDFALILSGVHELTTEVEDALFKAGCDDATLSIQYGNIYMEFSRTSTTLLQAILSAIQNVHQSNIGAQVCRQERSFSRHIAGHTTGDLRVECGTPSEQALYGCEGHVNVLIVDRGKRASLGLVVRRGNQFDRG